MPNEMAGVLIPLMVLAALAIVAIGPIWWWSRRIEKRIEPPNHPGQEPERLHFKYGVEPQGGDQTWGNLG